MNETERILRIILKVSRGAITVRELTELYRVITGTSIPHEDLGYWILTDYLTSIPHILSLERRFNELYAIVTSNEPREINTAGMYSFPTFDRQARLAIKEDYQYDEGFIKIGCETVEPSDTVEEERRKYYPSDSSFIGDNFWNRHYYSENDSSIVGKENWHLPSDIVDLDYEIQRDSISCYIGNFIPVVVDQVYDPSKFWLHKNDGRLHFLTEAMYTFYEKERDKYLIPETHMDIGRYCVAFRMNQYYRCVIVKKEPAASYVNVFFIDYGTLDKIPKDQIWFLTMQFSRLPAQAIRARLGDIYPPTENTPWSLDAIYRFHILVDKQPFRALVVKISNGVAHVVLVSPSNDHINSILVHEDLALFTYQAQNKSLRNIQCLPKYKSIYLFPDFREIEQWLVPSVDEIEEFFETHLTAEFFFVHCFWRPGHMDEHIQEKMKEVARRQEKRVTLIAFSEKMHGMRDMNYSLDDLYKDYNELLVKFVQGHEVVDTPAESDNESTLAEY